jgi:hypothetical protein
MGFGLGVTRRGVAALILGGNLFSKRAMEFATEFLFVAATAVVNDRLKHHKLKSTAFRIADLTRDKLRSRCEVPLCGHAQLQTHDRCPPHQDRALL